MLQSSVRNAAVIDGRNAPDRNQGFFIDGNYNVVDGFEIRNCPKGGIAIYGDGNRILNNEIHHNGNPASTDTDGRDGVYSNEGTTGNYYVANSIHDNGRTGSNRKPQSALERPAALDPVLAQRARVARATFTALRRYVPGYFAGRLTHYMPCEEWVRSRDEPHRWRSVAQHVEEYFGPAGCNPDIMLLEPYAPAFAALFKQCRRTAHGDLIRASATTREPARNRPSGLADALTANLVLTRR